MAGIGLWTEGPVHCVYSQRSCSENWAMRGLGEASSLASVSADTGGVRLQNVCRHGPPSRFCASGLAQWVCSRLLQPEGLGQAAVGLVASWMEGGPSESGGRVHTPIYSLTTCGFELEQGKQSPTSLKLATPVDMI